MKIPLDGKTYGRAAAALLRNCLTHEYAPLFCQVRKCRRDGFCSGPIFAEAGRHPRRIAATDCADLGPGERFAPVCYRDMPHEARLCIDSAWRSQLRTLSERPGATALETTRVIASRRWRRLRLAARQAGGDS